MSLLSLDLKEERIHPVPNFKFCELYSLFCFFESDPDDVINRILVILLLVSESSMIAS